VALRGLRRRPDSACPPERLTGAGESLRLEELELEFEVEVAAYQSLGRLARVCGVELCWPIE